MLNLTASAWARQQKLQRQGASSKEELDWVQFRHLLAQQRLAAAEGKTDKVREFLDQLLTVTTQMHQHALESSHATEDEKEYYRWEYSLQNYRVALAQRGQLTDYENIWELDGWTHIPHQPRG
jgi:predicted metal-binding transcription factor (methanogenesis marker protein 9)